MHPALSSCMRRGFDFGLTRLTVCGLSLVRAAHVCVRACRGRKGALCVFVWEPWAGVLTATSSHVCECALDPAAHCGLHTNLEVPHWVA